LNIRSFISGLSLLRYPELVKDLGERRFHLQQIADINKQFPGVKFHRNVVLVGYLPGLLDLGESSSICEGTVLAFGDTDNGFGKIHVGTNTWIGQYNNLRSGVGNIVIGDNCLISQFCNLVASNYGTAKSTPIQKQTPDKEKCGIILESDVWLGAGVSILPGVRVGEGAIVGAGSVVSRDVPPYEIWAGVGAQKIGDRE